MRWFTSSRLSAFATLGLLLIAGVVNGQQPPRQLHFGFYDGVFNETRAYSTLNLAPTVWHAHQTAGLPKMTTLLFIGSVLFYDWAHRRISPDVETVWATFLLENQIPELLKNGTIHGFNFGDEMVWNCLSPANLTAGANLVRKTFPRGEAILWYNEAAAFSPDGFRAVEERCASFGTIPPGTMARDFRIPTALDWISTDIYHINGAEAGWMQKTVRSYYESWIFPNLTSEVVSDPDNKTTTFQQKVMLVPGSFGSNLNRYPNGTSVCDKDCYDRMCALDAPDFYSWAMSDERVAAIAPWNFNGCPLCTESKDELGTVEMPQAHAAWEKIGQEILGKEEKEAVYI